MKKTFNSEILSYITLFLSPVYLIKFSILKIPLNLLDLLMFLTILFWFIENKENFYKEIRNFIYQNKPLSFSILIIIIGALSSSFSNNNLLHELAIIKSWFILPIIFSFVVYQNIGSQYKKIDLILNLIFYSSFLISVFGLIYFISGNLTYDSRLKAFYLSPNHLIMILAPGFLIGLWNIFLKKKIDRNKFLMILIILSAILLTRSYFGIVSILLSFCTLFLIFHRKNKNAFLATGFIFLTVILFLILEKDSEKIHDLVNLSERTSLNSRLMIWKSSFKIILDNWLWGIGPGNFQEKYLLYQKYFKPYLEWAVPQPHNLLLAFWLQTGLIGLLGFMYLIIYHFFKIIKALLKKEEHLKQLVIIFSIFLYFIIHGLIDTPYWKNDLSLIFWIIVFITTKTLKFQSK